MKKEQEQAIEELNRLKENLGTWRAVGTNLSRKSPGTANSWMVIANAVSNGVRRPSHRLLVALGIRSPRRRFSCDVPRWMNSGEEEMFRSILRGAVVGAESFVRNNQDTAAYLNLEE